MRGGMGKEGVIGEWFVQKQVGRRFMIESEKGGPGGEQEVWA